MNDKEKREIDKDVLSLVLLHLKVLKIEPNKENIKMATVMFIAGVQYINEKYQNIKDSINIKNSINKNATLA